jgi:hypothetical protein
MLAKLQITTRSTYAAGAAAPSPATGAATLSLFARDDKPKMKLTNHSTAAKNAKAWSAFHCPQVSLVARLAPISSSFHQPHLFHKRSLTNPTPPTPTPHLTIPLLQQPKHCKPRGRKEQIYAPVQDCICGGNHPDKGKDGGETGDDEGVNEEVEGAVGVVFAAGVDKGGGDTEDDGREEELEEAQGEGEGAGWDHVEFDLR